jgi:hypothetical protein
MVILTGCVQYHPAPLIPLQVQADFMARSYSDPGLQAYIEKTISARPGQLPLAQDLSSLTLAAFYYSPELEIAQARLDAARAAILTAGSRLRIGLGSNQSSQQRGLNYPTLRQAKRLPWPPTNALVFLPVLTLSGVEGRLFAPLAMAYIFVVFASLAVAMTLTPALSVTLLARKERFSGETAVVGSLKRRYRNLLASVLKHPRLAAGIALFLIACAIGVLPALRSNYHPGRAGGFIFVSRSKRLWGVANAAPILCAT